MAYLKELERDCQNRCGRKAKVELLNSYNSSNGVFCRSCGKRELKRLEQREDSR